MRPSSEKLPISLIRLASRSGGGQTALRCPWRAQGLLQYLLRLALEATTLNAVPHVAQIFATLRPIP